MKIRSRVVKVRACDDDDWYDDYPAYYETGQSYELGGPVERPRLRSVSPAAHAALNYRPARPVGFHRPKASR